MIMFSFQTVRLDRFFILLTVPFTFHGCALKGRAQITESHFMEGPKYGNAIHGHASHGRASHGMRISRKRISRKRISRKRISRKRS